MGFRARRELLFFTAVFNLFQQFSIISDSSGPDPAVSYCHLFRYSFNLDLHGWVTVLKNHWKSAKLPTVWICLSVLLQNCQPSHVFYQNWVLSMLKAALSFQLLARSIFQPVFVVQCVLLPMLVLVCKFLVKIVQMVWKLLPNRLLCNRVALLLYRCSQCEVWSVKCLSCTDQNLSSAPWGLIFFSYQNNTTGKVVLLVWFLVM